MFLDYFALGIIFFVAITLFYGIIVLHDIPYEIAKKRNHPHLDAIHVAGWVSLFTLHVIWPFLWIWATLYREDRGWGFVQGEAHDGGTTPRAGDPPSVAAQIDTINQSLKRLEARLAEVESTANRG